MNELSRSGTELSGLVPKLKDRDQWIAWEEKERDGELTKFPVDPHTGSAASSTDPETWATYEKATEFVENTGRAEGLGFVFSESGTVAGVDLDHCVDPDTLETEQWAADIVDTLDSYTEVSPSGDGIHVLVHGFIPEGGNRKDGVEMYDSGRFFTFTGEHVSDTPTETKERAKGLKDVHSEHIADEDDGASERPSEAADSGDSGGGVPSDVEDENLIERAKAAENGDKFARLWEGRTTGYDSHSEADMALAEMLAFWTGRDRNRMDSLFRESGLMRDKWDEDRGSDTYGEITIDKACQRCSETYTPGSGSISKNESDDGMAAGEIPVQERERAMDTIRELTGRYSGLDDPELTDDERRELADALGKVPPEDFIEYREVVSHILGHEPDRAERDYRLYRHLQKYGPVMERDGEYVHIQTGSRGQVWTEDLTNFTINVKSFMEHSEDDRRVIKADVKPDDPKDPEYTVDVEPKVFNRTDTFENNFVTGFSTRYDGGKPELSDLREYLSKQDAPLQTGTELMGLHADGTEFVTPEGTLTSDGWASEPETMHMGNDITAFRKWNVPSDMDEYDEEQVRELLEILPRTRDPERFLPALGWFYSAPLRPLLQEWAGHFPVLSVHGDTGSGKTATLSVLWQMFGMDSEPLSCTTTAYAQLSTFAASNAVPMWLDEYKPTDIKERRLDALHEFIRKSTKGATESRGKPDGSTESYHLKAPVCVSGEQRFQGPAERRRSVMTNFRDETTKSGRETSRRFSRLTGETYMDDDGNLQDPEGYEYRNHALAYYTWILEQQPDDLKEIWKQTGERVIQTLERYDITEIGDTERQGLQTLAFGWELFQRFADDMGADTSELPGDVELDHAIIHATENVGAGGSRRRHVDVFTEYLADAAFSGYLESEKHYKVVKKGDPNEEVRVNLKRAFPEVKRWARDHDMDGEVFEYDEIRDRFRDEAEKDEGYVTAFGKRTPPISRAVAIDTESAAERLDVDRSMFVQTDGENEQDAADGDSDGGDGGGGDEPTALDELSEGDWGTVTVEVLELETDTPDAISQKGVVADTTAEMGLISWSKSEAPALETEQCYRLQNVAVDTDDKDGGLYVSLNSRTTVDEVSHGYGKAPTADPGQNATLGDAAADGGEQTEDVHDPRKAVIRHLDRADGEEPESRVMTGVMDRFGIDDRGRIRNAISTLMESGKVDGTPKDGELMLKRLN